jgi:spore germination protein PC
MNISPEWIYYLQQLNGHLHYQNQQIREMNDIIRNLVQEVNQLKENTQPPVIRNEYKFDLLKVETLSGSLSIGIKPTGTDSSIEEFAVEQSMSVQSVEKEYPELYKNIRQQVVEFLNHGVSRVLKENENKYDYKLDDTYRNFIVEDVRKQIDERIHYYLNRIKNEQEFPEQSSQMQQTIVNHVIRDIERTIETFIKNLPHKGEQS